VHQQAPQLRLVPRSRCGLRLSKAGVWAAGEAFSHRVQASLFDLSSLFRVAYLGHVALQDTPFLGRLHEYEMHSESTACRIYPALPSTPLFGLDALHIACRHSRTGRKPGRTSDSLSTRRQSAAVVTARLATASSWECLFWW